MRQLEVFAGCTDAEIDLLDDAVTEVTVSTGRELLHEGAIGRQFAVIAEGVALVTRRGEEVARLTPGSVFGEHALLSGEPMSASITSVTPMRLYVFDPQQFQRVLDQVPSIAAHVREHERQRSAANEAADRSTAGG